MRPRDRDALGDIVHAMERACGFPIPDQATLLTTDYLQDALIRCLEVIGEASKRLSNELRDQHPQVPWRSMAGMRDLLIHAYDTVDLEEIWEAYQLFPALSEEICRILGDTPLNP
jgi:uncharacterized protein with HEPN domain